MIRTTIAALLMAALALPAFGQQPPDASFRVKPHVQNVTQHGATLIWETVPEADYEIDLEREETIQETGGVIHRLRLTELEPGTEYAYEIQAGGKTYANRFETAPAHADAPVTFLIFGDTTTWKNASEIAQGRIIEHAMRWDPELIVNTGDLVKFAHHYQLWPGHFRRFESVIGEIMMVTARGNHDEPAFWQSEEDWFARYHEFPGGDIPYAAFDWGNTRFFIISCNEVLTGEAAAWLSEQEPRDDGWVVVAQHFPPYSVGYFGPTDSRREVGESYDGIIEAGEQLGADLNVCGHNHIYERTVPILNGERSDAAGVHYVIQGGCINANYPDKWTAFADDRTRMALPTYTVLQSTAETLEGRTFAAMKDTAAIEQIDHWIIWRDERVPQGALAALEEATPAERPAVIERLGAMMYVPAAPALATILDAETDGTVRRAAALALRRIGSAETAPQLVAHLNDPDEAVQNNVARALEMAMPASLTETVAKHAADAGMPVEARVALLGALQLHGTREPALETASSLMREDVPEAVYTRAAYAVGALARAGDAGRLMELFQRKAHSEYARKRLAYKLNKLTGASVDLGEVADPSPERVEQALAVWRAAAAQPNETQASAK